MEHGKKCETLNGAWPTRADEVTSVLGVDSCTIVCDCKILWRAFLRVSEGAFTLNTLGKSAETSVLQQFPTNSEPADSMLQQLVGLSMWFQIWISLNIC